MQVSVRMGVCIVLRAYVQICHQSTSLIYLPTPMHELKLHSTHDTLAFINCGFCLLRPQVVSGAEQSSRMGAHGEDEAFGHGFHERKHTLASFEAYSDWVKALHFLLHPRPHPPKPRTQGRQGWGGAGKKSRPGGTGVGAGGQYRHAGAWTSAFLCRFSFSLSLCLCFIGIVCICLSMAST